MNEACVDCGERGLLDREQVCASCRTERGLDQDEHYAEEA
jgi:hypothetical protein